MYKKEKQKNCLNVLRYFYFLREAAFPLDDSKWNKSDHFKFWLRFADFILLFLIQTKNKYNSLMGTKND